MPHLSQLQRDYKDKNVTIIGMTSADASNTLEAVKAMVEAKKDVMDYAVAWDVERKTNEAWMKAANQRGIPASFLVDQAGKIAWIGHPGNVDIPMSRVVAGTWDYKQGPELMERFGKARVALYETAGKDPRKALTLLASFKTEYPEVAKGLDSVHFDILSALPEHVGEAKRIGLKLVDQAIQARDPMALNQFAWNLVDPEVGRENRFLDLALRAANKANEFTLEKDAAILDTVARVHFWLGDLDQALKIQKLAVEQAEGEMKDGLQEALKEYEQAIAAKRKA